MAVDAPEPGVQTPYLYWSVSPAQAGATFEIEYQTRSRWLLWWDDWTAYGNRTTITDCVSAPCSSTGDLDPDLGEFQVTNVGAHRIANDTTRMQYQYQVRPATAPSGFQWTDTAPRQSPQSARVAGVGDLGAFVLGTNAPASCVSGTFYSLSTAGAVNQIVRAGQGATISQFGQFPSVPSGAQMNALGIGVGGTVMYAAERQSGSSNGVSAIHRYSVANGWQRFPQSNVAANTGVVLGAVNLADGRYYFGGFSTSGGATTFQLFVYDPAASVVTSRGSFTASLNGTSNGDLAFDALGNLFVVQNLNDSDTRIYTITAAAVAAGGTMPVTSSPTFDGLSGTNGAAFDGDGTIYLGSGTTVRVYDPSTGALRPGSITTALPSSGDLASCLSPATITLRKDVVGRVASSDQFALSVQRGTTVVGAATTTGSATGIQPVQVGPLNALAGQTYAIQETISANAGSYTTSYTCVDELGSTIASGSARSGSVTVPSRSGANVVCTFRNAPLVTTVVVQKLVEDAAGTQTPAAGWSLTALAQATTGSVTASPSSTQTSNAQGEARWSLLFGTANARASIAVSETQRAGYSFVEGECVVTTIAGSRSSVELPSAQGATLTGIAPGSSVECTIVNRLRPTTLTLVKDVTFGTASANLFTLSATAPTGALAGPTGRSGSATATDVRITPAVAYRLSETGGPATYAQVGSWTCVNQSGATVQVTAAGDVTAAQGDSVTCTVRNATANLVILERIEGTTSLTASQFSLTSTPTALAGLQATTVTGSESVASGNTVQVRPGHSYALDSTSTAASIGLRFERYTGTVGANGSVDHTNAALWVAADAATVSVAAGLTGIYRFVATAPTPFVLPTTGGIGTDQIHLIGGGLAALALLTGLGRLLHRRAPRGLHRTEHPSPRRPGATPNPILTIGTIKENHMNTTTRRKGSRLVAGLVAAGIGVAAALGMATPAMAAPDSSNINPAATGSIVVHKFEQPTVEGTPSTGSALAPAATSGLTPVQGVTFSVRRVTHATALDLTKSSTWQTLRTLTPANVTAAGSGYALGTAATQVTSSTGIATFSALPVGVYLVEETAVGSRPVALRAQPFLVSIPLPENNAWVYDVHVYPKNAMTGITLAQDTTASRALGDTIKYTVTTNVPNKQAGNPITSYVITDTLDAKQVTYASSVVRLGTTVLNAPGTTTPDYTLTTDAATGLITVTLTPAGLAKVNGAPNGSQVILEVTANVTALEDGTIENNATVNINSTTTVQATQVVSNWGAARIIKFPAGAGNENLRLQGAVFEVRLVGSATAIPVGTSAPRQTQFTTGENGEVVIPALIAGNYELVEITAPVGYQVNSTPIPFTVVASTTANAVQVKVANTQVPAFMLPVTGGSGQMAFMIGGGALLLVAAGAFLVVAGRRRADQQA